MSPVVASVPLYLDGQECGEQLRILFEAHVDQCWEMCQRKVRVPDITKLSCRKTLTGLGNETWLGNMLQVIIDGSLNGRIQETTGNIWKIIDKQWIETAENELTIGWGPSSSFVGFLQSLSRPDQNSSASDAELAGVQPSEAPLSHSLRGIAGWESIGFSITLMCLKMGNPWGIPQMATLILGT